MALLVPEKMDGGRAIVIEDVPAGTGIADLIAAFSPFGAIRFASVGPPAVVAFETQASAAHALLAASMKSVSLLGAFREKKLQVPPAVQSAGCSHLPTPRGSPARSLGASLGIETSPNKAATASPTEAAAAVAKTSNIEAAAPEAMTGPNEVEKYKYLDNIIQLQDQLAEHLLDWASRRQFSLYGQRSRRRRGRRPAEVTAPEAKTGPNEAVCKEVEKYLDDIIQIQEQLAEHMLDWACSRQQGSRPAEVTAPETKISRIEAATAAGLKTKTSPEEAAKEILKIWFRLAAAWCHVSHLSCTMRHLVSKA